MLIQLTPEQVLEAWDLIGDQLEEALVPTVIPTQDQLYKVLKAVLEQKLGCWFFYKNDKVAAVLTTMFLSDPISGYNNLVIYSLNVLEVIEPKDVTSAMQTIQKFARASGCPQVLAFADDPGVLAAAQRFGARTDTRLLKWEV